MRRWWPLTLVLVPALAAVLRVEPPPLIPPEALPRVEVAAPELTANQAPISQEQPSESVRTPDADQETPREDKESWRNWPISRALVWMGHHQNTDGSWGDVPVSTEGHVIGKTGITSLAVLSFLGQGYSHLSRDEYDGLCFGFQIQLALRWLMDDQRGDGSFRSIQDAGFDQALAALALSEAFGMTASNALREPALNAMGALGRMQGPDGGWGGPGPTAWAIVAARSAESSDLPLPEELKSRALVYVGVTPHESGIWSRWALSHRREGFEPLAAALTASPPDPSNLAGWYHAASSLHRYDGPDGPVWKSFREAIKGTLLAQQRADGAWPADTRSHEVVRTSLVIQTFEVFWNNHPAVFGPPP
jgi:hypothetical protein